MPSRAPYQMLPYSSQFLPGLGTGSISPTFSREQQCSQCQCSSGAGESGLSSLECVDHCHPFSLQDVPGERRPLSFFFGKEVSCHGLVFVVIPGAPVRSLSPS